jgi:anti-sigma B factor antagonist
MDVTIQLGADGSPAVIVARGRLDVHSAPGFRETVARLLEVAGERPQIDLSALTVGDPAGSAALTWLLHHSREFGGTVRHHDEGGVVLPIGGT